MSAGLLPSLNTLPQAATEHTVPGRVSGRLQGRARPVSGSKGHQLASPLLSVQQAGWSSQISLAGSFPKGAVQSPKFSSVEATKASHLAGAGRVFCCHLFELVEEPQKTHSVGNSRYIFPDQGVIGHLGRKGSRVRLSE